MTMVSIDDVYSYINEIETAFERFFDPAFVSLLRMADASIKDAETCILSPDQYHQLVGLWRNYVSVRDAAIEDWMRG